MIFFNYVPIPWIRSERRSKWEGFGQGDPGDLEERQGRSSVCVVSGSPDCFCTESGRDDLLHEQTSGERNREGDSHQDAGEASGETTVDCLDLDEEKGEV